MIVAVDEPGSGLNDSPVAGNVLTFLVAGEDTTANTLTWLIYLLHGNPDAMRRAKEEVLAIAPDPTAWTMEQMDQLVFLDACAQEALRLKPAAPIIALESLQDTIVGDVEVPKGTSVY